MGGVISNKKSHEEEVDELIRVKNNSAIQWRLMPSFDEAKGHFAKTDGVILKEPGHVELRALLDEPLAQKTMGKYAKEIKGIIYIYIYIFIYTIF
jgi:hypothetical protein